MGRSFRTDYGSESGTGSIAPLLSVAQPLARSTKAGINSYKRGASSQKGQKIPLCFRFHWKHRGFSRFGDDGLAKKETAFLDIYVSVLPAKAGLEGFT